VLYYTPQILEQAGVGVLLSNIGISSDSASILVSALTTLLMLPSIGVAMRLMDISGRRLDNSSFIVYSILLREKCTILWYSLALICSGTKGNFLM